LYVPASQGWHTEKEVALGKLEKVPAGQSSQKEALGDAVKVPGTQGRQRSAPAAPEKAPTPQGRHASATDVPPNRAPTKPAGHWDAHTEAPSTAEKVDTAQGVQLAGLLPPDV
jgi:hypothetical protein